MWHAYVINGNPGTLRANFDKNEEVLLLSIAVAQRLAMIQAQTYLAERSARADLNAFDQLMARPGGEPARIGDEMPTPREAAAARRK